MGVNERWFEPDQLEWREQIIVPFCWESLAAWGEGDTAGNDNYYSNRVFRKPLEVTRENHRHAARYEVGWYRREITIPDNEHWRGRRVIVTIGAADFFTDCWCNGVHLGHHEGGYDPFEFDLTDALGHGKDGKHLLVFRVEDPMDNSEQPVGKQWRWYTTTSGIWQTVFLEPRHATYIHSFQILTDIDAASVHFAIRCSNVSDGCTAEVEATLPDGTLQTASCRVEKEVCELDIKLKLMVLWDPNAPHVYPLRLRLRRGPEETDSISSYFGMRKIDVELANESGAPAALRVNNVSRYLRGALYQSYHPDGVYTAGSVETLKHDISEAKRFGFNFLRIHIKVDDPLLLYWADKLGILLMADFPNFGEGGDTPLGRRRFEEMMRRTIERDFNHPSIFAWCLFNETWGFGGLTEFVEHFTSTPPRTAPQQAPAPNATQLAKPKRPAQAGRPGMTTPQAWVQDMWELAKSLDPARLVEDMSVCHWEHLEYYLHCDTDINSWHFYLSDYEKAKEHLSKVVSSTFVGSTFNYVPGFKHKGQPLINSEYGGVGALDGDRDVSWSFKFLTNEMRRYQQISAYIYTELHDVEWEYNGFLNYDRTPKEFGYDPRIINESNTLPIDAPPVQKAAPGELIRLRVDSSHYSTRKHERVSLHWEMGGVDTRGKFRQDVARGRVPIVFPHRKVALAHVIEARLPDEPMLCTMLLSARAADGSVLAENFLHYFVYRDYPPRQEEVDRGLVLRAYPADWTSSEWSGGAPDREVARQQDRCEGTGHGFFEWSLPFPQSDLGRIHRIKVLCEASSHRTDHPQTDTDVHPTTLHLTLNNVPLYRGILRNHPHDSRGVLSYWRGGLGAYGYLVKAFAEGEMLQRISEQMESDTLKLRFSVPEGELTRGGLTIYGAECGRFPVTPTILLEWR